jgi:hypothetical protein
MITVKKAIVVAISAAAVFGAAPLAASPLAAAKNCPYGTVPTEFSGVCVSGQAGGFGSPGMVVPPDTTQPGPVVNAAPGELPTVDGITCTPQHLGTCIGLQNQG